MEWAQLKGGFQVVYTVNSLLSPKTGLRDVLLEVRTKTTGWLVFNEGIRHGKVLWD